MWLDRQTRLVFLAALFFVGAGLVCFLVSASLLRGLVERQARAEIMADITTFEATAGYAPVIPVLDAINARLDQRSDFSVFEIQTRDGAVLMSNLAAPAGPAGHDGWFYLYEDGQRIIAREFHPDGMVRVIVGRRLAQHESYIMASGITLAGGAVVALILSWTLGYLETRRVNARISAINAVFTGIEHGGRLSVRLDTGTGDRELDALAHHVNLALARLERQMEWLGAMADTLAHEMRRPIARLTLLLDDALREPASRDDRLEDAAGTARGAMHLFSAVLDLADIETGAPRAKQSSDLADVAGEAVRLHADHADNRQVSLNVDLNAAPVAARRDHALQLVVILLDNAIKYGAQGHPVELFTGRRGDRVCLEVRDRGPGPSALPENATGRHVRGGMAGEGHGLGLWIARAIALRYSASLAFEPREGGGLTVRVLFPAAP